MSEVTFAKQFLATLDKRPIKLAADHVSDARKHEAQSPYVLPRQTHPFPRRQPPTSSAQAKSKTVTATLKPMRGGATVTLSDVTLDSTIHDIKTSYSATSGNAQDKIKLLLNKKPAADLKTLQELGVDGDAVEFTVMLMGGASAGSQPASTAQSPAVEKKYPVPAPEKEAAPDKMEVDSQTPAPEIEKAQMEVEEKGGAAGGDVEVILKSDEFWNDLKGFLAQRLKDDKESEKLAKVFREAYGK